MTRLFLWSSLNLCFAFLLEQPNVYHGVMFSHHLSCTQGHGAAGAHPSCHGVKAGLLDKWMIKRLNLFHRFKEKMFSLNSGFVV